MSTLRARTFAWIFVASDREPFADLRRQHGGSPAPDLRAEVEDRLGIDAEKAGGGMFGRAAFQCGDGFIGQFGSVGHAVSPR